MAFKVGQFVGVLPKNAAPGDTSLGVGNCGVVMGVEDGYVFISPDEPPYATFGIREDRVVLLGDENPPPIKKLEP